MTGVSDRSVNHWGDVIQKNCSLDDALIPSPHHPSLFILPAPQSESPKDYTKEEMEALYCMLSKQFDFVLIDCPTGAEQGFHNAVRGAEKALIVVQCEATSIRDCDKIAHLLTEQGLTQIQLIINRYQADLIQEGILLSIEQVMDVVKLPLIGIIPEDKALIKAVNSGESIFQISNAKSAACYSNIAKRLLGQEVPLTSFKTKSLLNRMKHSFQ